jgi:hypothetical protein
MDRNWSRDSRQPQPSRRPRAMAQVPGELTALCSRRCRRRAACRLAPAAAACCATSCCARSPASCRRARTALALLASPLTAATCMCTCVCSGGGGGLRVGGAQHVTGGARLGHTRCWQAHALAHAHHTPGAPGACGARAGWLCCATAHAARPLHKARPLHTARCPRHPSDRQQQQQQQQCRMLCWPQPTGHSCSPQRRARAHPIALRCCVGVCCCCWCCCPVRAAAAARRLQAAPGSYM